MRAQSVTAGGALAGRPFARASVAGVAIALSLLAGALTGCKPASPPTDGRPVPGTLVKPTFDSIAADNRAAVTSGEALVKGKLDSVQTPLTLVGLYNERARLTGDYDDYGRAEDLLARLEGQFGKSDSLCMARAKMHFTLHRLAAAKQVLDGCPRLAAKGDDLGLRADIAFYSGRYKDAGIIYRALVNQVGNSQAYIQLALFDAKTGAPGEASAMMEAAEARYHGASALQESWFALQRGLIELDRGHYDEARSMYALADERLPGYWLNQEHMAEATRLKGDTAAAKAIYQDVVKKTGAPEYLDALAIIDAEAGDATAAKDLLGRAETIYEARAKRFPEAIAGHALAHYLTAAPQPAKALALAQANFKNRPYGDAAIALAKAYLLNARPGDARRLLEQQLAQGWDTAEAWWILSLAADASGEAARAKTATLEANRRNPHSATQYAFKF
jgi:tetratricopeptide (TPR) repeat protein